MQRYSLFSTLIIAVFLPVCADAAQNLLFNGGFETEVYLPRGRPDGVGYWEGDVCKVITATDEVSPFEAEHMLHFIYSDIDGPSGPYAGSNLWQLVDVGPVSDIINTANATATLSAYFNRILGDDETDTKFVIEIYAFAGDPATFLSQIGQNNQLANVRAEFFSDGDPSTWENLSVDLAVPVGTDFIAVDILAVEDIFNDALGVEFDGHYADAVSLTIVPEPATFSLLGLGALLLGRKRN